MEFSAKRILRETKKKSDCKFPIKKFHSADFDRVSRVRGNKLIFNFGLKVSILFVVVSLLLFLKAVCSE